MFNYFILLLFMRFAREQKMTWRKGLGNGFTTLQPVNMNECVCCNQKSSFSSVVCLCLYPLQRSVRSSWRMSSRWRRRGGRPHPWWATWDRWPMPFLNSPCSSRLSKPPPAHSGETKCKPQFPHYYTQALGSFMQICAYFLAWMYISKQHMQIDFIQHLFIFFL